MNLLYFFHFISLLIGCTINFQVSNICEQIVQNRKKQGGIQNIQFKKSLSKLEQAVHHDCIVKLQPKYVWAQNMSFIFVKLDFQVSSRTSCSQVLLSQRNIDYQGFQIKQYCLQSQKVILYSVKVKTFKNLNYHFSRWKTSEMNSIILEVLKSPSPYFWPRLYSQNSSPKHKPRIWWQLQQRLDQSVQKYMGLLEIDETEVEVSSYVKKLKRSSAKNAKINSKDYSNIQFYCNQGSPYFAANWD